jgi:O-antigen/teichoic acid export membrane protein
MVLIRAQQRSTLYVAITVGSFSLSLGLNILFLVGLGWGTRGILLSALLTQALTTGAVCVYTFARTGFRLSFSKAQEMAAYGFPHIPGALAAYVINFADRYFLQRYSSLSELGVYSLGYKFGMVIGPLVTEPFMAIWGPKMFELLKQDDRSDIYANMLTYFLYMEIFIALVISVTIKDVIAIMSAPEFHDAYRIVPMILLSYIIWGAYNHVRIGILAEKRTKYIAYVLGAAALLNVALNVLLIPRFGMWGAAVATLASFLMLFVVSLRISNRFLRVDYQFTRILKLLITAIVIYVLAQQITVSSPYLSIFLKAICVVPFPFLLLVTRFYTRPELDKIRELAGEAQHRLRRRRGN